MSLFTARRKPKRIARDDPEPEDEGTEDSGPVVRRPTSSAPKNKSKLRVIFNPGDDDAVDSPSSRADEGTGTDDVPTKPSRKGPSLAAQSLLLGRSTRDDGEPATQPPDRPSYSKAYLDELRNSTPSTPRDLSARASPTTDLVDPAELDVASKFGTARTSAIPSTAEIREKKERRARLALEATATASASGAGAGADERDFISLDDYNSDGEFKPRRMQVGSYYPPEKSTRLVRDDEDLAEGFEAFVEDAGRVTLSKRGLRDQARRERDAMRTLIDRAEDSGSDDSRDGLDDDGHDDDDDSADSDRERRAAYDAAQTHRGMDGLAARAGHARVAARPRQPRDTAPIPTLAGELARLRDTASALALERATLEKRRADVARARAEVKASQEHIQRSLEEAGRELERVQQEQREREGERNTARGAEATAANDNVAGADGVNGVQIQRGPSTGTPGAADEDEDEDEELEDAPRPGLGLGMGMGMGSASGPQPRL